MTSTGRTLGINRMDQLDGERLQPSYRGECVYRWRRKRREELHSVRLLEAARHARKTTVNGKGDTGTDGRTDGPSERNEDRGIELHDMVRTMR